MVQVPPDGGLLAPNVERHDTSSKIGLLEATDYHDRRPRRADLRLLRIGRLGVFKGFEPLIGAEYRRAGRILGSVCLSASELSDRRPDRETQGTRRRRAQSRATSVFGYF